MVEGVLVKQVRLIEEKDGMDAILSEILHVGGDGVEDASGGNRRRQTEGDAKLAIEVAATEGDVVSVGKAECGLGQALAKGA